LAAPEACWRLFSFEMYSQSKPVVRLAVHLKDQQTVNFSINENLSNLLEQPRFTTLMGWFNYNSIKQDLLNVTYLDFPKYAKWNSKERVWIKREIGQTQSEEFIKLVQEIPIYIFSVCFSIIKKDVKFIVIFAQLKV
jgi:hypothetical protein